jgi:uncharacterized protein (TIGR02594 family)
MKIPIPTKIDTRKELEVYLLQYALKAHGFSPKGLDGIMGINTETAFNNALIAHMKVESRRGVPAYLQYAQQHIGIKEVPGEKSNKTILAWIKSFFSWASDDGEIAWCAIFINKMLERAGMEGTGKANAKSFLDWGRQVYTPYKGDIVVFHRGDPKSWKGHVGIYIGQAGPGMIYCLGGNQSNGVNIRKYSESKIVEYRRSK